MLSNASFFKISVFPKEDEILFFPFSAFIIDNVINKDDIYFINLEYIGIYEERIQTKIETVKKEDLNKIINESNFSKDAFQLRIIPREIEKTEANVDNIGENIINEIIEINNENIKKMEEKELSQINCIYKANKNKINLINNTIDNRDLNKEINEDNIEIFIDDNPIDFSFVYENEIRGEINVKFKFKNIISNLSYMFSKCSSLKSVDFTSFNSSNITNISFMFFKCSHLKAIDLTSFNTSNVTNMISLFHDCSSLKRIDLSKFNTSKVKSMESLFNGCSSLKSLDIANFDTRNVTNMSFMFHKCSSLTTLDLSSFYTKNVTNMASLFQGCSSLESLNISSFNTRNVTDMSCMFSLCSSLQSVDLSKFNTDHVTKTTGMFYNCTCLWKEIIK